MKPHLHNKTNKNKILSINKMLLYFRREIPQDEMSAWADKLTKYSDDIVVRAVDKCISLNGEKDLPNLAIFTYYLEKVRTDISQKMMADKSDNDISDGCYNKDLAKETSKIISEKMNGRISMDDYIVRLFNMHNKYPHAGFDKSANQLLLESKHKL